MTQSLPSNPVQEQLVEVIELARAGDSRAFTILFQQYNNSICTYLAHLVGNDEVGRDLAQETFLRVWKSLPKIQGEISFLPWLYRIATNVARSYLRRERLMRWLPWVDEASNDIPNRLQAASPEELACEQECIKQVLASLPPNYRTCLLLQHVAGFAQREIAAILGISEKSVSVYVSRGREQFRLAYRQLKGVPIR